MMEGIAMDDKVYELLNDQINKELYSAYLYLDMANFYADKGLAGFQNAHPCRTLLCYR